MTKQSRRFLLILCLIAVLGLPLAALNAQGFEPIRLSIGAAPSPQTIFALYGSVEHGADFGLTQSLDDIIQFESTTVATQAVLAGQADVLYASFTSTLLVRQAGQDMKMFCPGNNKIDHVLVGRNGITTIEQVFDPATRVGIDAVGGGSSTLFEAAFLAKGISQTTKDLSNIKILESVNLRHAAFVANDVDVTTIRLSQFRQSQKDVPDGVVITETYKDFNSFIFAGFTAPAEWLAANRERAAAYCAAMLKGIADLSRSSEVYIAASKTYLEKPPTDAVLQESYELITGYGFWAPSLSMNPDSVAFMAEIGARTGALTMTINPNDVLDLTTYEAALALLSEEDRAQLLALVPAAANPEPAATSEATKAP